MKTGIKQCLSCVTSGLILNLGDATPGRLRMRRESEAGCLAMRCYVLTRPAAALNKPSRDREVCSTGFLIFLIALLW